MERGPSPKVSDPEPGPLWRRGSESASPPNLRETVEIVPACLWAASPGADAVGRDGSRPASVSPEEPAIVEWEFRHILKIQKEV